MSCHIAAIVRVVFSSGCSRRSVPKKVSTYPTVYLQRNVRKCKWINCHGGWRMDVSVEISRVTIQMQIAWNLECILNKMPMRLMVCCIWRCHKSYYLVFISWHCLRSKQLRTSLWQFSFPPIALARILNASACDGCTFKASLVYTSWCRLSLRCTTINYNAKIACQIDHTFGMCQCVLFCVSQSTRASLGEKEHRRFNI